MSESDEATEPVGGPEHDHDQQRHRVAVIYNPTKIADGFQGRVTDRTTKLGLGEPLWLETTADDPGRQMAEDARRAEVEVVLAAGGDGTVRVVAAGLAGSGIPLAIIPEGTGNLLARNLGLPLDEDGAVEVAFGAGERELDVISLSTDDENETDRFAVMAGIGLDAAIMSSTDKGLKSKVGAIAYVTAALQQLGREPRSIRVTIDDQPPLHRKAMICLVGNVGALQGGLELIPGAKPDDGLLDVVIASPRKVSHWLATISSLITRKSRSGDKLDQLTGRKVVVELDEPDEYQLDGDTIGSCTRLAAEIEPGALRVRVPEPAGS